LIVVSSEGSKRLSFRELSAFGSIAMVAAAAVVTFVLLSIVTDGGDAGTAAPGSPPAGLEGRWGTSERDRLSICVDAVSPPAARLSPAWEEAQEGLAKSAVDEALIAASLEPGWGEYNAGYPEPLVAVGCAGEPALYDPSAGPFISQSFLHIRGRIVTDFSPYFLHVFVLPQEEIDRYDTGWRFAREEILSYGDHGDVVTAGLYVSPEELANTEFFHDLFLKAIGLRRAF
jgi:hypothetical protein